MNEVNKIRIFADFLKNICMQKTTELDSLTFAVSRTSTIMISYSLQPFVFWQLMKWPWYKKSVMKKVQKK